MEGTETLELTPPAEDGSAERCPSCAGSGLEPREDDHEIRCFNCFGSGIKGDGLMHTLANRKRGLEVGCPTCGAAPYVECVAGAAEPDQVPVFDALEGFHDVIERMHTRRLRVMAARLARLDVSTRTVV